jgi:hypothetical protein
LELALVAFVGGSRLVVSVLDVRSWLQDFFGIPDVKIQCHYPEDFHKSALK